MSPNGTLGAAGSLHCFEEAGVDLESADPALRLAHGDGLALLHRERGLVRRLLSHAQLEGPVEGRCDEWKIGELN